MKAITSNWLLSADYDIKTASSLLKNKRFIYVVFMCHLSLEKSLKAVLSEKISEMPPYTHNLNKLIGLARIELPERYQMFIDRINLQSVLTRYPEDFTKLSKEFDKAIAEEYLKRTREIIKWLKKNILKLKLKK
jgi:HEPN domain-containing protein